MISRVSPKKLDYTGVLASSLCLFHCLAMPFVVNLIPSLSVFKSEALHLFLAALIVPLATYSVLKGFKKHGRIAILLAAFIGSVLIVAGLVNHHYETILTVTGGLFVIYAHISNMKLSCCSGCDSTI